MLKRLFKINITYNFRTKEQYAQFKSLKNCFGVDQSLKQESFFETVGNTITSPVVFLTKEAGALGTGVINTAKTGVGAVGGGLKSATNFIGTGISKVIPTKKDEKKEEKKEEGKENELQHHPNNHDEKQQATINQEKPVVKVDKKEESNSSPQKEIVEAEASHEKKDGEVVNLEHVEGK